ncbi:methyltransferase domain-containing protein [Marinobacter arenosus]|uniref:methyltransferase domain-containing protein n=1 Tax=Marinobacter arenosus TaxID=2856822 RepID=UPI001C4B2BA3|nr:methyltransferase domain-containing protein [Marinobacter arenosus]MBW0147897.1 methyltransferase domain-containing protein [Marinobacter arenosus]
METPSVIEPEATARAYEARLVPALFQDVAKQLADGAAVHTGQDVLDVACGTGILARAISRRFEGLGSVTGVDLNPGMLAVAQCKAPGIHWQQGDAEALPFSDRTFDVVVSQFGLMLFPSPTQALREMYRVLRPRGRLTVAVFDSITRVPAYQVMSAVYSRIVDPAIGRALQRPFSLGDTRKLTALFADAGISAPDIRTLETTARFPEVRDMALADIEGWFPFADIHLDESTIEAVIEQAEAALLPFCTDRGTVEFQVPVHVLSAVKF